MASAVALPPTGARAIGKPQHIVFRWWFRAIPPPHVVEIRFVNCADCHSADTRVNDSRPTPCGHVRRRRQCKACGARFTTHERVDVSAHADPLELAVVEFVRGLNPTPEEATP